MLSLAFIFLYSIAQAYIAYRYMVDQACSKLPLSAMNDYPNVTIQLPVYNELYVVERLIDCVAKINYPPEKLEIQILDDSTDETKQVIAGRVKQLHGRGVDIVHIHRENRAGFKAGALREGSKTAKGEFIAIFDADFLPTESFLMQTLPQFYEERIGMVQTRWEHINREFSLLTRLQAFALDAHFRVEQTGRNASGCYINFNGTAGIWRKACIVDAGDWQDDTLTEDLDLSYRAQLRGWKFKYLEEVSSPAELPPVMSAFKSQQYRWNKGAAETARKHLKTVITSPMPLKVKWQAIFHLLNSGVFIAVLVSAICSIPLLHFKSVFPEVRNLYSWLSIFLVSFIVVCWVYFLVSRAYFITIGSTIKHYIRYFPLFLSVSMGLSLHNAIAVAEGYFGVKTPFVRTPKFNLKTGERLTGMNKYLSSKLSWLMVFELIMVCYFSYGIYFAFSRNEYAMLPFHFMLVAGYSIICFYSLTGFKLSKHQQTKT